MFVQGISRIVTLSGQEYRSFVKERVYYWFMHLYLIVYKSKGLNHAGDTTYKTQSYPNSIMTKIQLMYKNITLQKNTHIGTLQTKIKFKQWIS